MKKNTLNIFNIFSKDYKNMICELNQKKYSFYKNEMEFLGFLIKI